jgi:Glycosyl hydrolases family 2, sugar binding domain/Glycosyl hydrolases family 2, TIM barrel domain/Glycosyl hydrolases family 2
VSSPKCSLSALDQPVSLAGDWEFQLDPDGELGPGSIRPDRTIPVPMPWQAAFPDLRRYAGYAWYRRTFEVEGDLAGGDLRLHFGAVDYWCEVFLNGLRLGAHEGGYLPFEFSLRDALRSGSNVLVVRVFDPVQSRVPNDRWPDFGRENEAARRGPPFAAAHVPHGKQDWYVNTGGIWQDVTITPRPAAWIDRFWITPDLARSTVGVSVVVAGDTRSVGGRLRLEVRAAGATVAASDAPIEPGRRSVDASMTIPAARAWTLESPFLYELVGTLEIDGRATHTTDRFGMRSFTTSGGRFELNGEPIYLIGVLDQDFHPTTVSTVPSRAYLYDQFATARRLGFNTLRCHIKPPDPIYLDVADEVGLLVWEELPSWRTYSPKGTLDPAQIELPSEVRRRVETTLDSLIERDSNHPSVVIRTLVNEDWGTALPLSAADRRWLVELYDRAKRLDPTRLVVDDSACAAPWGTSFHIKSDIDDFHLYATIPDQAAAFVDTADDLALRPLWTYSPHGDAQRRGDEPIVLSEFGNWSLPTLGDRHDDGRPEPEWFDLRPWGAGYEQEPGSPAGVADRFGRYGLDSIWPDYDAFARATQAHQVAALRFQIEELRRRPSIAGYVVTELTDTYWESNGILDFERRPKGSIEEIAEFNAGSVLIASPDRASYRSGQTARIDVHASLSDAGIEDGSRLEWRIGDDRARQVVAIPALAANATAQLTTIEVPLRAVDGFTYVPIALEVVGPGGETVLRATRTVAVLPEPSASADDIDLAGVAKAGAAPSAERIADFLETAAHPISTSLDDRPRICVAAEATAGLLEWVAAGGRLLFLAERHSPFFWMGGRGGAAQGWITSYSWLRSSSHGRLAPAAGPLGLEFVGVMPERTIVGLPFEDPAIQGDVLAGMVTGWIHHPTAHTIQFRFGQGRVVMTTFRLTHAVASDPVAGAMLLDLIDHLASDRCEPALSAPRRAAEPQPQTASRR